METTHLNNLSYEEKYKLATNEGTPAEILAVLAKDKIYTIRRGVALNESTKSETLAMLAKDDEWRVREAVALNRNTPLNTLKILANDKEKAVRKAANKALNERKMNTKFNKER